MKKHLLFSALWLLSTTSYAQTARLSEINIALDDRHPEKYVYKYKGTRAGVPPKNIISEHVTDGRGELIPFFLKDPVLNLIQFDTMYYFRNMKIYNFRYIQTFNSYAQPVTRLRETYDANSPTGYTPDTLYHYSYNSIDKIDTIKTFIFVSGSPVERRRVHYRYDLQRRLIEVLGQESTGQSFQTATKTGYKYSASVCIEDSTIYPNGSSFHGEKNVYTYNMSGLTDKKIQLVYRNGNWDTSMIIKCTYDAKGRKIIDSMWGYWSASHPNGVFFYDRRYHYHVDGRDDTDTCYSYSTSLPSKPGSPQCSNKVKYNPQWAITEVDAAILTTSNGVYKLRFSYETFKDTVVNISSASREAFEVEVYPSLSNGLLNVKANLPASCNIGIAIVDMTGRPVREWEEYTEGKYNNQVDVQDLAPGNYFVKLSIGDQYVVKRFTKL